MALNVPRKHEERHGVVRARLHARGLLPRSPSRHEPEHHFYGSRTYRAHDPEGHVWNFSQSIAQPSREEMSKSGWTVETPPLQREGKGDFS
ncbi:MAG: hypothetical protein HXY28_06815 [Hydrogenophilaceae bacterium]|jgi:hypothetical protein|nr:hypothetical protein [Hydrogenophilaceae bacterium]